MAPDHRWARLGPLLPVSGKARGSSMIAGSFGDRPAPQCGGCAGGLPEPSFLNRCTLPLHAV